MITTMLNDEGILIGRFKVRRLMSELGLICKQRGQLVCQSIILSEALTLPHGAKHESPGKLLGNAPMERVFRSLKSNWNFSLGCCSIPDARKDICDYLMDYRHRLYRELANLTFGYG